MKNVSNRIIAIQIPNQKDAISAKELAKVAKEFGFQSNEADSIEDAFYMINQTDLSVCICGSLYLAGEILKLNNTIPK